MQIQILKFIQIHFLRHESELELAKTLHAKKKNLLKQRRKKGGRLPTLRHLQVNK